jgi:putative addiction module component (TIGR02574 family)
MTPDTAQLLEKALLLPDHERADMIARLLESLDPATDENVEGAWNAEIQRRLEDLDSGKAELIPWPEARRLIQEPGDDANES